MARVQEFKRIGVDAVFVEALPDREAMKQCVQESGIPTFANIIEGGKTENLSAKDLAELGFCAVAYPWTLVAANLKSIRGTYYSIFIHFSLSQTLTNTIQKLLRHVRSR